MAKDRVKTHLLLPDIHFPDQDEPSMYAVQDFLSRNRVDGLVYTGDQLSLDCVSHWNSKRPLLRPAGALKQNIDGFKKQIFLPIEDLIQPSTERVWITGNHERFIADYIEEHPELQGLLNLDEYLGLSSLGYKVLPLGGMHQIGHLRVIHGDQVGSNIHIAKKLVDTYGCNVVMGHVHSPSSFTRQAAVSQDAKWTGTCLPTLGTVNPSYARNRVNSHTNGFGIVEQFGDLFNLYTVIISGGMFSHGGQLYGRTKA